MRTTIFALALILAAANLQAQAVAPADTLSADLTTTLDAFQSQHHREVGATFAVRCPAGPRQATIWGTGTYTSDSAICVA
ncbi:MAG TPA: LCCL domain-containing protein, partial [Gemmatimonadota bacterium]|nr:LCCL domain-containing protein [Gemmatimonadota bacterium]